VLLPDSDGKDMRVVVQSEHGGRCSARYEAVASLGTKLFCTNRAVKGVLVVGAGVGDRCSVGAVH
jgi:hypothetical protein